MSEEDVKLNKWTKFSTERDNQRFDRNGKRLVVGSVPYRVNSEGAVEFMAIASSKGNEWIFPKGGWENFETSEIGAKRETFEEAGVEGTLSGFLGTVPFKNSKDCSPDTKMLAFLLLVTGVRDDYKEASRPRKWFSVLDAHNSILRGSMVSLFRAAVKLLNQRKLIDDETLATIEKIPAHAMDTDSTILEIEESSDGENPCHRIKGLKKA